MNSIESILVAGFWCSFAGITYAYLGYPALLLVLSRLFGRTPIPPPAGAGKLPKAVLLIAAHNEEDSIAARLHNALALDYPADLLDIVVASDGSSDRTVELSRRFGPRVRVLEFPVRAGKAATLNAVIPTLHADVVVLSDANTFMDRGAVRALSRWFTNPSVGAVCGRLELIDAPSGRNADGLYWKYENFLKRCEGRLGGPLGANGAIYAIRRDLFTPLRPSTILDDFQIPLAAKISSGCRVLYDPDAIACEETPPQMRDEFRRRARIATGAFQSLRTLWPLLHPRHGWTALAFWSHKILRWLCPLLLIATFGVSLTLAGFAFFRLAFLVQCGFYGLAILVALTPSLGRAFRPLRILPLFATVNLALLVGFFRWFTGSRSGVWRRTSRAAGRANDDGHQPSASAPLSARTALQGPR